MTKVWYHANCSDGFGAAFAAWLKFKSEAEYVPVVYNAPPPDAGPGDDIYIVDFSYPPEVLADLAQRVGNVPAEVDGETGRVTPKHGIVTVLDHHKTAAEELTKERLEAVFGASVEEGPQGILAVKNCLVKFDMNKSGCVLAWEWFMPEKMVPDFFLYLQDRDLWKWKLPYSREISAAVRSYPQDFEEWRKMSGIGGETWEQLQAKAELAEQGVAILRAQKQIVEQMAKRACLMGINTRERRVVTPSEKWEEEADFEVMAVNAPVLQSEVCEYVLQQYPEIDIAAAYSCTGSRTVWSLRSRPGVDCSVVAKAMGGGGHERAAGFRVEMK